MPGRWLGTRIAGLVLIGTEPVTGWHILCGDGPCASAAVRAGAGGRGCSPQHAVCLCSACADEVGADVIDACSGFKKNPLPPFFFSGLASRTLASVAHQGSGGSNSSAAASASATSERGGRMRPSSHTGIRERREGPPDPARLRRPWSGQPRQFVEPKMFGGAPLDPISPSYGNFRTSTMVFCLFLTPHVFPCLQNKKIPVSFLFLVDSIA